MLSFFLSTIKNNVPACISLVSLAISLYNWYYNFKHTRAKINIIFKHCKLISNVGGTPLSFYFIIENLSHLDVSISRMFLCIDDCCLEFDTLPCHILKYTSPEENKIHYSPGLPITIPGLGACGDFFCIRLDNYKDFDVESLLTKHVSLIVKTNRNFEGEFELELNPNNTILHSSVPTNKP